MRTVSRAVLGYLVSVALWTAIWWMATVLHVRG